MDASSIRTSWRIAALILAVHVAASVQGLTPSCLAEPLPEGAVARLGELCKFDGVRHAYRAIQVLEQFGTPAVDELLKQFASGVPGRQTTEAQLAVERRSRNSR